MLCNGASHSASRQSSSYKTGCVAQAIKSVPGQVGKLLLFVLPKHQGPCILDSGLQKATVTFRTPLRTFHVPQLKNSGSKENREIL